MKKIVYLILLGIMFLIPKDVFAYEVSVSYETDGYIYNSASTLLETPKKSGGGSWNSNLNPNRNGIYSNFFTNKLNNINGINSDSFYNIYGHINISRILPSPSCVDCSSPDANINFLEEFYYDYKATNTYTNVKCRLNNIQVGVSQVSADFTCNNVRLNTTSQGFRAIYNSSMLSWIGFSTTLDIVEVGSNSEVVKGLEDMKEEQEKTNEKLDGINDSITSTEGPDLGSLENSAGWLPAGPVDSILNLPLTLMNNIVTNLSKSCSPITFSLPFVHEQMTLPCISTIYSQIEGLSVWINTISYMVAAIILFHYFMTLYKWVDDTLSFRENNWNDTDQWGGV